MKRVKFDCFPKEELFQIDQNFIEMATDIITVIKKFIKEALIQEA